MVSVAQDGHRAKPHPSFVPSAPRQNSGQEFWRRFAVPFAQAALSLSMGLRPKPRARYAVALVPPDNALSPAYPFGGRHQ